MMMRVDEKRAMNLNVPTPSKFLMYSGACLFVGSSCLGIYLCWTEGSRIVACLLGMALGLVVFGYFKKEYADEYLEKRNMETPKAPVHSGLVVRGISGDE